MRGEEDLAEQLVSLLSTNAQAELLLICGDSGGMALSSVSDVTLLELERLLPRLIRFDYPDATISVRSERVRLALIRALQATHGSLRDEPEAMTLVRSAIASGEVDEALDIFERNGGVFFAHVHGLESSQRVINAFPEAVRYSSELLILADAINAMKSGNVEHAKYLLAERFSFPEDNLQALVRAEATVSADFACCRLVLAVCEEEEITDGILAFIFRVLERLPPDSWLKKGMLYNVVLDAFFRRRQWGTAEETALRAKFHFNNAQAPLSVFYMDLYLALIALARGSIAAAQACLAEARRTLARVPQPARNDVHLLRVLDHVCDYELGEPRPLADFLLYEMQEEAFGEVWPSIAWPIIYYGSHAMASCVTLAAARAFIDGWRLQQWRSSRFANTVALSEADILQFYGRWHEAEETLRTVMPVDTHNFIEVAGPSLGDLTDNERIEGAMKWCRSILESEPGDAALAIALQSLAQNERLAARQRIAILIWMLTAARARKDWPRFRDGFSELADLVQTTGLVAVLVEHQQLFGKLLSDRESLRHVSASSKVGAFLRDHKRFADPRADALRESGLTRQEERILLLLAERVSNKIIARRLGLSLATVRFHLKNVYRKLNSSKRDEAVRTAIGRGILSE